MQEMRLPTPGFIMPCTAPKGCSKQAGSSDFSPWPGALLQGHSVRDVPKPAHNWATSAPVSLHRNGLSRKFWSKNLLLTDGGCWNQPLEHPLEEFICLMSGLPSFLSLIRPGSQKREGSWAFPSSLLSHAGKGCSSEIH